MHRKSFSLPWSTWTLFLLGLGTTAFAEDHLSTVTAEHQLLKHELGTWDAVIKTWSTPDAEPTVSRGTETNQMLGELWVVGAFEIHGSATLYRGQSQVGYDPSTNKFIGTWIDTSHPRLNTFEGTRQGNTLSMTSKDIDPKTGQQKLTRMITTYVDADHKTYVSFEPVPGKAGQRWKTMEVSYTRRK